MQTGFYELERELHDLCQPLTALQCRLEIGKLTGGEDALAEAVDGGLDEMRRVFDGVSKLREHMVKVMEGTA